MTVEYIELSTSGIMNVVVMEFDNGNTLRYNNGSFTHSIHTVDDLSKDELARLCIFLWFCGVTEPDEIHPFIESASIRK